MFSLPEMPDEMIVDILNFYPLWALQDNYIGVDVVKRFFILHMKRLANKLMTGNHDKYMIVYLK